MKKHDPDTVAAPIGAYSHAIEVPANARRLYISGQVGIARDGTVGADTAAQTRIVWENVRAILEAAGMGLEDVIKVNTYLTSPADLTAFAAERSRFLGELRPTSTLVFVSSLVKPEFTVEVDIVAARVD